MKLCYIALSALFIASLSAGCISVASNDKAVVTVVDRQLDPPKVVTVSFAPGEPCTLISLIFKLNLYANRKDPYTLLVRADPKGDLHETKLDFQKILRGLDPRGDIPLQDGDRIVFPGRHFRLF